MTRAVAPVIGTVLLVGMTVVLVALIGVAALGIAVPESPAPVVLEASADADAGRVTLLHGGGPPLDVRDVRVWIAIDGTPLDRQPPVPFFSAAGFRAGPTGPFNTASDPKWEPGETASLRLASTNAPALRRGATLTVRLYRDGSPVATAGTTVR